MSHGSWSTFSLVNIPFLTFRFKLFSLYVQIYYILAICTKHPKFCILVFSLYQMFVGEGSAGRKHLNLQIFPGPWGRKKCAALCLVAHHPKLRIANSLSHCFFLGETGNSKDWCQLQKFRVTNNPGFICIRKVYLKIRTGCLISQHSFPPW